MTFRVLQPHTRRSPSFFGALSGHMSRSPTKYFKKPTPSGVFARTPSSVIQNDHHATSSATQIPKPQTFVPGSGGKLRTDKYSRSGNTAKTYSDTTLADKSKSNGIQRSSLRSKGQQALIRQNSLPGAEQCASHNLPSAEQSVPQNLAVFSSATSWRQRSEQADLGDRQSQSAPLLSKSPGKKQVAFSEETFSNKDSIIDNSNSSGKHLNSAMPIFPSNQTHRLYPSSSGDSSIHIQGSRTSLLIHGVSTNQSNAEVISPANILTVPPDSGTTTISETAALAGMNSEIMEKYQTRRVQSLH